MMNNEPGMVRVGAADLHALTEQGCIETVLREIDRGRGGTVVTHNIDHLRLLEQRPDFAVRCAAATLRVADGVPVLWAAQLQKTPLPGRVAGSDLFVSLSAAASIAGRSIYLIGGDSGTAEGAAAVFRANHPDLKIAGVDPFPHTSDADERTQQWERLAADLAKTAPDIIYVALPAKAQLDAFDWCCDAAPAAWVIGVGVSFSFLTGEVRRAPEYLRTTGFEWVHRLIQQPELSSRYLRDDLGFALRLLFRSWRRGRSVIRPGDRPRTTQPPPLRTPAPVPHTRFTPRVRPENPPLVVAVGAHSGGKHRPRWWAD